MRRQRGMALVIVLWLIVLLGVMAAGHSRNVQTDTRLAAQQVEAARARALAEAGIKHVALEFLGETLSQPLPTDGTVFPVYVRGEPVTMAVRKATGLVDLNHADAALLEVVLDAGGLDMDQRAALVDTILDWRDGDNLTHLNGVEDGDYLASGVPWTSRDGEFSSVDELRYLPGVSQALFERIAPLLTVHSGRGGLDLESAPAVLVGVLSGSIIRPASQGAQLDEARPGRPDNGTFHIYATAAQGAGVIASLEAVVYISRSAERPVTIVEWRDPPRVTLPPLPEAGG